MIRAAILALAVFLSACATQIPSNYLDYGYATVKAMRETCTERFRDGRMTKPTAIRCRDLSNQTESALDIAFDAGDPTTREGQLRLAQSLIAQLEKLLMEAK